MDGGLNKGPEQTFLSTGMSNNKWTENLAYPTRLDFALANQSTVTFD
jgi:hypothetical protein